MCKNLNELFIGDIGFNPQEESNNLKMLSLKCTFYNTITESFMKHISTNLPELKVLTLFYCNDENSDKYLQPIRNFPKLETLKIQSCLLTGSTLASLYKLKELYCKDCKKDYALIALKSGPSQN